MSLLFSQWVPNRFRKSFRSVSSRNSSVFSWASPTSPLSSSPRPPQSLRNNTTVHRKSDSRDKRGRIRTEPDDRLGDLFRSAKPAYGMFAQNEIFHFRMSGQPLLQHRGEY